MRFRVLFIAFNAVLLVSFLLIFFMPAMVLGWEYAGVFWAENWLIGAVFLVMLGGLNAYFVANWTIFTLLEREAWADVVSHLTDRMHRRGRVSRNRARILVNALVVSGRIDRIGELEAFLREHQPTLVPRLAMELGVPYLLSQDGASMEEYFGGLASTPGVSDPLWVRWSYAFGLLTQSRFDEAQAQLMGVLAEADDAVVRPLTAHMLEPFAARDSAVEERVREARAALRAKYSPERLARELEHQRQSLQVLFLASRIEEAYEWVHTN